MRFVLRFSNASLLIECVRKIEMLQERKSIISPPSDLFFRST
jgi:hypothetical protein